MNEIILYAFTFMIHIYYYNFTNILKQLPLIDPMRNRSKFFDQFAILLVEVVSSTVLDLDRLGGLLAVSTSSEVYCPGNGLVYVRVSTTQPARIFGAWWVFLLSN